MTIRETVAIIRETLSALQPVLDQAVGTGASKAVLESMIARATEDVEGFMASGPSDERKRAAFEKRFRALVYRRLTKTRARVMRAAREARKNA